MNSPDDILQPLAKNTVSSFPFAIFCSPLDPAPLCDIWCYVISSAEGGESERGEHTVTEMHCSSLTSVALYSKHSFQTSDNKKSELQYRDSAVV